MNHCLIDKQSLMLLDQKIYIQIISIVKYFVNENNSSCDIFSNVNKNSFEIFEICYLSFIKLFVIACCA